MYFLRSVFILILVGLLLASCSSVPETKEEADQQPVPLQITKVTETTIFPNDFNRYDPKEGAIGVYDVPEMLVLSVMDSCAKKDLAQHMEENYAILEKERKDVGAEMNGPMGVISYNTSLNNFVFESVMCIKQVPKMQPKKTTIVVLETSKMLIYNFYGPYSKLNEAYAAIGKYCNDKGLVQTGPIREFYITIPSMENDPGKLFTRIFLPVLSKPK